MEQVDTGLISHSESTLAKFTRWLGTLSPGVSSMQPAKAFCTARYAFWEFSSKQDLSYLFYSLVLSSRQRVNKFLQKGRING